MEARRFDGVVKQLATGLSRRQAMTGVAAALGLSAFGARSAPTAAGPCWAYCQYECPTFGFTTICQASCHEKNRRRIEGESCASTGADPFTGCWGSRSVCLANPPN
jgi:uncharacterized protein (DUF697 family)